MRPAASAGLRERSIPRRLWDLSLPVIGLNVLNVLAMFVDTAMCGRVPNAPAALTGLGFAGQIVFLLQVAILGLVVGSVATISRAHGAGDRERVAHVLRQSTQLAVLLALVIGLSGAALAEPVLHALGARGAALTAGVDYLRPMMLGCIAWYLTLFLSGVLRAVGNTRLPFMVALGVNALNVVLNYAFILGNLGSPALGVFGSALGTLIAQGVGVVVIAGLLVRGAVPALPLSLRPKAIDVTLAKDLLRIGAPAAADMLLLQGSFLAIVGMLGRVAPVAVAAHGIGLRIQALAFVPGLGVSQATGAMVGQALGAGNADEARRITRASVGIASGIMAMMALPLVIAAHPVVAVFGVEPGTPLEAYAVEWIRLLGYGMPIVGVHIAFVGMLRGAGATRTSLAISAITCAAQVPASAALGFGLGWGAFGIWLAFPFSFAFKAALDFAAYRRGGWATLGGRV